MVASRPAIPDMPRTGCLLSSPQSSSSSSTPFSIPHMTEHASSLAVDSSTEDADPDKEQSCPGSDEALERSAKRARGRSGCLNCRRRRKKCDERKPTCNKCKRFNERCEWDSGVTFRLSGIDPDHPSMRARKSSTGMQNFHMVDVTFDSSTHRRIESRKQGDLHTPGGGRKPSADVGSNVSTPAEISQSHEQTEPVPNPLVQPSPNLSMSLSPELLRHEGANYLERGECLTTSRSSEPAIPNTNINFQINSLPMQQEPHRSARASVSSVGVDSRNSIHDLGSFTTAELEALDYLTSHTSASAPPPALADEHLCWPAYDLNSGISPSSFDPIISASPDQFSMYYPNQEYRDLHCMLYNHMVDTARGTGLTRQGTPEIPGQLDASTNIPHFRMTNGPSASSTSMSKHREMELWNNYIGEIATWLDMFDNERHFQNTLPLMAESSQHLRLSILALSARQMERRDPNKPYTESLRLYQDAIQMIVQDLQAMDTAVIASCVLLCVLEMMSSSPRDWARHLEGCAMLIKAAGINGVVGGVRQAIFWCFARMDMWGGFLTDTNLKIPTGLWFLPSGSMSAAVSRFKADFKTFDQYANYAVFLCASALNVISNDDKASHSARWRTLFDLLEDWYSNRPPEMRPILSSSDDGNGCSFPIILYTNPPAISGNQLYHAAALLMLEAKPRQIKIRSHKSIFWHARQICGITASNPSHSAYTNAPQPLWIAGRVLSHPSEHHIVLDLLARIERETGFATSWRAEDLKVHWGEFDVS